jgi:hypothetical protein
MCRHTLKSHLLFNVARCACRHIGAQRCTTRSSPRWALAPGTASPGLSNARLTQTPRWSTSRPRPRVCAPKRTARYCDAAQSTALRRLRAVAQTAPQNRFCGQRAAVEAFGFRSAIGKAGSHDQRFARLVRALVRCHGRARLASHRAERRQWTTDGQPHASLLHNAAFCKVPGHSLASSLGGRAPLRALRVRKTGVMQSV